MESSGCRPRSRSDRFRSIAPNTLGRATNRGSPCRRSSFITRSRTPSAGSHWQGHPREFFRAARNHRHQDDTPTQEPTAGRVTSGRSGPRRNDGRARDSRGPKPRRQTVKSDTIVYLRQRVRRAPLWTKSSGTALHGRSSFRPGSCPSRVGVASDATNNLRFAPARTSATRVLLVYAVAHDLGPALLRLARKAPLDGHVR